MKAGESSNFLTQQCNIDKPQHIMNEIKSTKPQLLKLGIKTGSCGSSSFKCHGDPDVVTTRLCCAHPERIGCRRPTPTISVLLREHLYSTYILTWGFCPRGLCPCGFCQEGFFSRIRKTDHLCIERPNTPFSPFTSHIVLPYFLYASFVRSLKSLTY